MLGVLGVWMTAAGMAGPEPGIPDPGSRLPAPGARRREVAVAGGTFGLLMLYAFLLEQAGFLIATPLVIALTMIGMLRMRAWAPILSIAVGFTLGCWAIFDALLGTPLPRGVWVPW